MNKRSVALRLAVLTPTSVEICTELAELNELSFVVNQTLTPAVPVV